MNNLLEVKNISKNFHSVKGETKAIDNISFKVKEGEFIAIVGPSGCGKSTLLTILAKLTEPSSGSIRYDKNKPVIGYMLQEDALLPHLTILENVLLGLKIQGKLDKKSKNKAILLLEKYQLINFKDKLPRELSGGMKQRVALIRTLAINPDILFLDEPFSALDFSTRLKVSDDVYKIIKDTGKTVIMVTHDIGEAISMADRVIVLSKRPAKVKNTYEINLEKKDVPTVNRKDINFYTYYDAIWGDLDDV